MQGKDSAQILKVITLGPAAAGKTCIILKSVNNEFALPDGYMCTLGVDFKVKTHDYKGKPVRLHIWDTAGQERFRHINRMYYRDTHGVILVYDATDRNSFNQIRAFWDDFKMYEGSQTVGKILVGNKVDKERKVATSEGEQLARDFGIPFIESSAKTGENIQEIFTTLLDQIAIPDLENSPLKLKKDSGKESSCAC